MHPEQQAIDNRQGAPPREHLCKQTAGSFVRSAIFLKVAGPVWPWATASEILITAPRSGCGSLGARLVR